MTKYYIDYNNGIEEEVQNANTLEDVKKIADDGSAYTRQDIDIKDEENNRIATRRWYGCMSGIEQCNNPIRFGDFGFYDDWVDVDWEEL